MLSTKHSIASGQISSVNLHRLAFFRLLANSRSSIGADHTCINCSWLCFLFVGVCLVSIIPFTEWFLEWIGNWEHHGGIVLISTKQRESLDYCARCGRLGVLKLWVSSTSEQNGDHPRHDGLESVSR